MKEPKPAKSLAVRLGADAAAIIETAAAANGSTPRAAAELYIQQMHEFLSGRLTPEQVGANFMARIVPRKKGKK